MVRTDSDRAESVKMLRRRHTLKVLGGASLATLAGCLGDDDDDDAADDGVSSDDDGADDEQTTDDDSAGDDPIEFVYRTGPSDSLHFAMANTMASVVQQNSDSRIHLEASTAGQSLSELVRGNVELAHFDTLIAQEAMRGEGDFGELDIEHTPMQVCSMYFIATGFVVKTDRDLEYYNQLEGQRTIAGPPDAAFWFPLQRALDHVLDIDEVDVRYGPPSQIPEDLAADAVDAGGGPMYINGVIPGYIEQMFGQGVRMLGWTDDEVSTIQDDDFIPAQYMSNDLFPGIDEFTNAGETLMPMAGYPIWSTELVSENAIYDLLEVLWDHRETLADEVAAFGEWLDDEYWTSLFTPALPVHPGAAAFLDEKGVLGDEFEVGET